MLAEVGAFAVDHGADDGVFFVGGEINSDRLLFHYAGIAGQPAGCVKRADDLNPLLFQCLDRCRPVLGLGGQGQHAEQREQTGRYEGYFLIMVRRSFTLKIHFESGMH